MNFEAFLQQANDYDSEDDLFSRHTRFWSELNLTHPGRGAAGERAHGVGADRRLRPHPRRRLPAAGRRSRRPSEEFEDAVAHYRERFSRILDRAAGGVQELGRRLGSWLERFQNQAIPPTVPRTILTTATSTSRSHADGTEAIDPPAQSGPPASWPE